MQEAFLKAIQLYSGSQQVIKIRQASIAHQARIHLLRQDDSLSEQDIPLD